MRYPPSRGTYLVCEVKEMALSKTTQDHNTIRAWAEARGAMPAEVAGTHKGKQTGILRFAFPKAKGHNDENLREISWEEFFEKFDRNGLELIYQEKTATGAASNFNKLIYPESEQDSAKSSSSGSREKVAAAGKRSSEDEGSGRTKTSRSSGSSNRKKAA